MCEWYDLERNEKAKTEDSAAFQNKKVLIKKINSKILPLATYEIKQTSMNENTSICCCSDGILFMFTNTHLQHDVLKSFLLQTKFENFWLKWDVYNYHWCCNLRDDWICKLNSRMECMHKIFETEFLIKFTTIEKECSTQLVIKNIPLKLFMREQR